MGISITRSAVRCCCSWERAGRFLATGIMMICLCFFSLGFFCMWQQRKLQQREIAMQRVLAAPGRCQPTCALVLLSRPRLVRRSWQVVPAKRPTGRTTESGRNSLRDSGRKLIRGFLVGVSRQACVAFLIFLCALTCWMLLHWTWRLSRASVAYAMWTSVRICAPALTGRKHTMPRSPCTCRCTVPGLSMRMFGTWPSPVPHSRVHGPPPYGTPKLSLDFVSSDGKWPMATCIFQVNG